MLKSFGTEFKVGLFAIVAVVALGYMFFVLSPEAFVRKKYKHYYTVLENAAGIVTKTQVKTSGVTIGRVTEVALNDGHTRIGLNIEQSIPIPVGSKLEIRSVGLLGDKHLEIVRPRDTGDEIPQEGLIPQATEGTDLEGLIGMVGSIAKDVKKVTTTLSSVLGSAEGERSMRDIINNIHELTADLKETSATLRSVVGDRRGDLNDVVSNVRDGVRDLRTAAANIKDVASKENKEKIDRILAQFDNSMGDVRGLTKNINLISEKIEKGEGTVGKLINDDTAITELEGAIKDIRKVLAPATKLEVAVDVHGEYRRDRSSQYYINLLFKTRPDRYYLLGLTDTTYDTDEETVTTDTSKNTPNSTRTVYRDKKQKALRFNAQVAKRWYWFAVRAGLFETTGGIAADMYFWSDRFKLTTEAFEFDTRNKAVRRNGHFKAYGSVLFYNHIYAMIGLDDMSRTNPNTNKARDLRESVFFGGGLAFNDDDLKALFGTAALFAR
jgi:phospholipid/cholesterol/gamma-HCH transport system substrate-binding protein